MTDGARWRPGFRLRVLGSVAALLAGAVVVGLFLQRAALLRSLERDVRSSLDQERAELETLATGTDPETGAAFGDDVAAIFDTFLRRNVPDSGEVFLALVDGAPYRITPGPLRLDRDPVLVERWATLDVGERGEFSPSAGPVQFLAVPLRSEGTTRGVFVIANFTRGERDRIDDALKVEAAVSVVVLLAVTLIAWFVAGRLLRPVRELTTTARAISESDLTARIPVEGHDEISRLARTFNDMLDRLETAFVAQRAFVDDAGHELRTPITIIRGHLDLMGDDPTDRQETLALVFDELDRMARIVNDLLLLAKAEQPDFVRTEPVEVADLTTELLVKARSLDDRRRWVLDACAEGIVELDPQRVTQAVLNLARNAVEHTPDGAEIGVGSAFEDRAVRIWVRDTGSGVAPEDREQIFERFSRGGDRRRSDGAGLGLAIVRSVAVAHGGQVHLDSTPGAGATFSVTLPASSDPPGQPSPTTPERTASWHAS
jgi:two-component system, OmpR family, sensor kinase